MDHCLWQGWSFAVIPFTTTIKQMYNCRTGQFPSTKKNNLVAGSAMFCLLLKPLNLCPSKFIFKMVLRKSNLLMVERWFLGFQTVSSYSFQGIADA